MIEEDCRGAGKPSKAASSPIWSRASDRLLIAAANIVDCWNAKHPGPHNLIALRADNIALLSSGPGSRYFNRTMLLSRYRYGGPIKSLAPSLYLFHNSQVFRRLSLLDLKLFPTKQLYSLHFFLPELNINLYYCVLCHEQHLLAYFSQTSKNVVQHAGFSGPAAKVAE